MGSGSTCLPATRALVEHNHSCARPDPLLRHVADGRRLTLDRPSSPTRPSPHRPGSTATRSGSASRRFVRRWSQPTGLDVLYRQRWMHSSTGVTGRRGDAARRRRHRSSNHHASRQNDTSNGRIRIASVRPWRADAKATNVRRVGDFASAHKGLAGTRSGALPAVRCSETSARRVLAWSPESRDRAYRGHASFAGHWTKGAFVQGPRVRIILAR